MRTVRSIIELKQFKLRYVNTAMILSDHGIDSKLISWNKVVLLHGPPGIQIGIFYFFCVQVKKYKKNLCTTTTPGTLNFWPLLTGGRCSVVALC